MADWISPELLDMVVDYGFRIIGVVVILIVAFVVAKWAKRKSMRAMEGTRLDATLSQFFSNLIRYAILIFAGLACLNLFGFNITSFVAILAAAGFAIGLAFQGTLSNFSAGIMLLVFRPFKVGDVVSVGGVTAKVHEISLFTTQLDTPDNRRIIMPNSSIFGNTIENITYHDRRRVDVNVGTDYEADLKNTRAVLERVASTVEGGLGDPAPQVYLLELGGSSINWAVRVWAATADYWAVRERLTNQIKEALDDASIGIPYPQMDVHLDGTLAQNGQAVPQTTSAVPGSSPTSS